MGSDNGNRGPRSQEDAIDDSEANGYDIVWGEGRTTSCVKFEGVLMKTKRLSSKEILEVFRKLDIDTEEKRRQFARDVQSDERSGEYLPFVRLSNRSGSTPISHLSPSTEYSRIAIATLRKS
jgi:hypothetical protein